MGSDQRHARHQGRCLDGGRHYGVLDGDRYGIDHGDGGQRCADADAGDAVVHGDHRGPYDERGQTVSSLLGASMTDVDTGAAEGIAVTGVVSGNGGWEYSTDGGATWVA